ncbi:MAG: hypothetical protein ACOVOV_04575 [Dolichospermum sp.]
MKKKRTPPPVLLTQKTKKETIMDILSDEGKSFVFSDSLEQEFEMITRAMEAFKTTSSSGKTIKVLIDEFSLNYVSAKVVFDKMADLYSSVNREFLRPLMIEKLFENISETREIAKQEANPSAMAKADENLHKAIIDFLGTNKAIDKSKLKLPDVVCLLMPELFPDVPPIDSVEYHKIISDFKNRKVKREKEEFDQYEEVN